MALIINKTVNPSYGGTLSAGSVVMIGGTNWTKNATNRILGIQTMIFRRSADIAAGKSSIGLDEVKSYYQEELDQTEFEALDPNDAYTRLKNAILADNSTWVSADVTIDLTIF